MLTEDWRWSVGILNANMINTSSFIVYSYANMIEGEGYILSCLAQQLMVKWIINTIHFPLRKEIFTVWLVIFTNSPLEVLISVNVTVSFLFSNTQESYEKKSHTSSTMGGIPPSKLKRTKEPRKKNSGLTASVARIRQEGGVSVSGMYRIWICHRYVLNTFQAVS